MGKSASKEYVCNKPQNVDAEKTQTSVLSIPFINPKVKNFDEEVNFYKDKSMIDVLIQAMTLYDVQDCCGYRKLCHVDQELEKKFSFVPYGQIDEWSISFITNLRKYQLAFQGNLNGEELSMIGICARNCTEWIVTDLGCQMDRVITVPINPDIPDEEFIRICEEISLSTICVSFDMITRLINLKAKNELSLVTKVILFDLESNAIRSMIVESLTKLGATIYSFTDMIKPSTDSIPLEQSKPDDVMSICFSAGASSIPKGVMLSQKSFFVQMTSLDEAEVKLNASSVHISFHSLASVMERVLCYSIFLHGGKIGFSSGDYCKYLQEDMAILRPTLLCSVPHILSYLRDQIIQALENFPSGCKKSVAMKAIRKKREKFLKEGAIEDSLYDGIVFNQVREKFGGKLKVIISTSGALMKELADDLKIMFSVPVVETYGMTESCGICTMTNVNDLSSLSAGGCISPWKIKLEATSILSDESTGEICIQGPGLFKGYFKKPELTEKLIDKDGWFHTGDIGSILPNTFGLKVIERANDIIQLSTGECISPSKVEGVYNKSRFVNQIMIYGTPPLKNIIGIIVPNSANVVEFLKIKEKWNNKDSYIEHFFQDALLIDEIQFNLNLIAKENRLSSFEKISKFILTSPPFSVETGTLTTTFKLSRRKIIEVNKAEIDNIENK